MAVADHNASADVSRAEFIGGTSPVNCIANLSLLPAIVFFHNGPVTGLREWAWRQIREVPRCIEICIVCSAPLMQR